MTENSVTLAWEESRGPRLEDYHVYFATSPQRPFARAGETAATQTRVSGLHSGTPYYFVVRAASRRDQESANSNLAGATTPGLPPPPGALTPIIALLP